jgi:hypothetical protein
MESSITVKHVSQNLTHAAALIANVISFQRHAKLVLLIPSAKKTDVLEILLELLVSFSPVPQFFPN